MLKLSDYLETQPMGKIIAERQKAEKKAERRHIQRLYQGARVSRLDKNWTVTSTTANYEALLSVRILRARARDAARNNSHFKKYLGMVRKNVIGPGGIQLQSRARNKDGTLNRKLNKFVEDLFWDWGHKENCSASGKLSWIDQQKLFVTQLARDGEVLVQKVKADNKFGFALKFVDVSYLDETHNEVLLNGNRVLMGVEVDENDKPVAYHLTTPQTEYSLPRGRNRIKQRVRIEAKHFIHAFLVYDDESQTRGITWFHTALLDAKHLHGYKEGVITSAEVSAHTFGIVTKKADENDVFGDEEDEILRPPEIDVSPLSITMLDEDYDFKQFDPKQPTQNHAQFYKSMLTDEAIGLEVNYFSLAGDMESVNYSSARVGLNEERDGWQEIQTFTIGHFCREVFHAWLDNCYLSGLLRVTFNELFEIRNPFWRPRGWKYIDPPKEVSANEKALASNQTTLTDVLAEQGKDLMEHFETIKNEQELAKEYGVDLVYNSALQNSRTEEDPEEETGSKKQKEKSKT